MSRNAVNPTINIQLGTVSIISLPLIPLGCFWFVLALPHSMASQSPAASAEMCWPRKQRLVHSRPKKGPDESHWMRSIGCLRCFHTVETCWNNENSLCVAWPRKTAESWGGWCLRAVPKYVYQSQPTKKWFLQGVNDTIITCYSP